MLLAMAFASHAAGARFPNAVERTMVLRGENVASFARLLGIDTSGRSAVQVRLNKYVAWAVYLLKRDTPKELSNWDQGMPERFNQVEFSPSAPPTLAIGPYWLDEATRLPNSRKGCFSFQSPSITLPGPDGDAWARLIAAVRGEPSWDPDSRVAYRRSFPLADGARLELQVWPDAGSSWVVGILVEGVDR
jgi:hypothetical protein